MNNFLLFQELFRNKASYPEARIYNEQKINFIVCSLFILIYFINILKKLYHKKCGSLIVENISEID